MATMLSESLAVTTLVVTDVDEAKRFYGEQLGLTLLEARGFYTILSGATLVGVGMGFTSVDPIKALYWAAVVNGVIAVPIMVVMMLLSAKREVMGPFTSRLRLRVIGWLSTAVMAAAVIAMFATL